MGRTTQKDLSLSGFCFLVGKEQLYFHSFRITSHHRWSQHTGLSKGQHASMWLPELLFVPSLLTPFSVTISATLTEALHTSSDFSCTNSQILVGFCTHYTWRGPSPSSSWSHHAHLGQPAAPFPMDISTSEELPTTIWPVVTQVSFNDKEKKPQFLKPLLIFAVSFSVCVFLNYQLSQAKDAVWLPGKCLALWKHCH